MTLPNLLPHIAMTTFWVIDKPHGLLSVDGKALKVGLVIAFAQSRPQRQTYSQTWYGHLRVLLFLRAIAKRKAISANNLSSVFRAKNTKRWLGTPPQQRRNRCARALRPTTKPKHIVDRIGINAPIRNMKPCTTNCVRVRQLAVSPCIRSRGAVINYAFICCISGMWCLATPSTRKMYWTVKRLIYRLGFCFCMHANCV